jgi:PhoPQ-activated pathogenicity-related protein
VANQSSQPTEQENSMHRKSMTFLAAALIAASSAGTVAQPLARQTDLDDYVKSPDASFRWEIVSIERAEGHTSIVVDMVSQTWLSKAEVNRPEWQHWLTIAVPNEVTSDVGLLFIGGGRNGGEAPKNVNERTIEIARSTGTIAAELGMVPNQPLIFHNDGVSRSEDDLIGYTWDQYLQNADARWLARGPMVKSAVRAMDTITAVLASDEFGLEVDRFVVAGGSKRGWTTWLTGAMDDRVVAIAPIVIDVLNVDVSMRHHFAAYGFWAVSIGNYVDHEIMRRLDDERLRDAYALVDPYHYRHRLTMPKLMINAAGDQFFLPDSSRFYWQDLRGEKYVRYVPNADHSLQGTDAIASLIAFHTLVKDGIKPPQFSWTHAPNGTLQVMTQEAPKEVLLWQMTNPIARDFRVETQGRRYTSSPVEASADGLFRAFVAAPESGWTAYFMELTFDVGAATPLKLTTTITVTPDTLPFAGKPPNLETSVTMICTAPSAAQAQTIAQDVADDLQDATFTDAIQTHVAEDRLFVNWQPTTSIYDGGPQMQAYLNRKECNQFNYQLESGSTITLPPADR